MKNALLTPLGWLLSAVARLPLGALYVIADIIYFLAYNVTGYRRRVVERHIADAFPDYTPEQRRSVVKDFYHNFADYIVETIKLLHISDGEKDMVINSTYQQL